MVSAQDTSSNASFGKTQRKESIFFGVPIGRLGLPSRIVLGAICGFLAFFVTFFLAIIGMAIYDSATRTSLTNLNDSYLYIAAPVGVAVMLICVTYLVIGWARHKFSSAERSS